MSNVFNKLHGFGVTRNSGTQTTVDSGRLRYLEECLEILHAEHTKRFQAIHENNKIRKQNEELRKRNAELEKRTAHAETHSHQIRAKMGGVRTAALCCLHSGWLERMFEAGGLANVREAIKVAMGFDGLSQADIDLSA